MELRTFSAVLSVMLALVAAPLMAAEGDAGWTPLMDGKTFDNWKIAEPERKAWTVEDGAFVARGERSHLFYMPKEDKPFVNFELKVDVNMPMIGLFKRKAEKTIIDGALKNLKKRVEG